MTSGSIENGSSSQKRSFFVTFFDSLRNRIPKYMLYMGVSAYTKRTESENAYETRLL